VANGHMILQALACEGAEIGTIRCRSAPTAITTGTTRSRTTTSTARISITVTRTDVTDRARSSAQHPSTLGRAAGGDREHERQTKPGIRTKRMVCRNPLSATAHLSRDYFPTRARSQERARLGDDPSGVGASSRQRQRSAGGTSPKTCST
jgi:hypothetical protein